MPRSRTVGLHGMSIFTFWRTPSLFHTGCQFTLPSTGQEESSFFTPSLAFIVNMWWWWFSCFVFSNSCNHMDCSLTNSLVHGISQAKILEWVAISFSRGSSQPKDQIQVSYIAGGLLHCRQILYRLSHQGRLYYS